MRVAFTGFGPFPGVGDNPSARLIAALAASNETAFADCRFDLLDTDYRSVPPRLLAILADAPRALVLTGYSGIARSLTIERTASDLRLSDRPDAAGFIPAALAAETRRVVSPHVDFAALRARLAAAGMACALSDDAGSYVCNASYFAALDHLGAMARATPAVFVHIPAIAGSALAEASAGAMPLDEMVGAMALIADALAPV